MSTSSTGGVDESAAPPARFWGPCRCSRLARRDHWRPVGILLHHLVHDATAWATLDAIMDEVSTHHLPHLEPPGPLPCQGSPSLHDDHRAGWTMLASTRQTLRASAGLGHSLETHIVFRVFQPSSQPHSRELPCPPCHKNRASHAFTHNCRIAPVHPAGLTLRPLGPSVRRSAVGLPLISRNSGAVAWRSRAGHAPVAICPARRFRHRSSCIRYCRRA